VPDGLPGFVDGAANAAAGDSATNAVTNDGRMMARFMAFPYLELHPGHDGAPQLVHFWSALFVIGLK
jgi:hypothetical protein